MLEEQYSLSCESIAISPKALGDLDTFQLQFGDRTVQQNVRWLSAYISSYLKSDNALLFLRIAKDSDVLSFVSLQQSQKYINRFITLRNFYPLGWGPSDFYSIVAQPDSEKEVVEALASYWRDNSADWDTITLENIPSSNSLPLALANKMREWGFEVERKEGFGFYTVDTTKDWEEYFTSFIKPSNKDLLKDLRKMEREGVELTVQHIRKDVYNNLKSVLDLYAQRRQSLGQPNSYETAERKEFVQKVTTSFEETENVELSLLLDASKNVWAFQLDFLWDGVRYHWNHAYNEDYKKYSPGKILLLKLMEASFRDPSIKEVNHMRGASAYKSKLADTFNPYINLKIINPYSKRLKWLKVWNKLSYIKKWIGK